MSILSSMKSAIAGTSAWLRGSVGGEDTPPCQETSKAYRRTTTASRRREESLWSNYLHVSKDIPEAVRQAFDLGLPYLAMDMFNKEKGDTYDVGINAAKRRCDSQPTKRLRRKARAVLAARLRQQGIK